MNTERLNEYLRSLESRLRLGALTRGAASVALVALITTVLVVLLANYFAFSSPSILGARVLLLAALALTIGFALYIPVRHINRRNAARTAEQLFPQYQERLLTFAERSSPENRDPFLELLAGDAWSVAGQAEPRELVSNQRLIGFAAAAVLSLLTLGWLASSGPGFLGHGANLVWGGLFRTTPEQPFYNIIVQPGDRTVRRGSDQLISAQLVGFQNSNVRLFARYGNATKWEEAVMQPEPGANGFQFMIAGISESAEYYVEAGGIKSPSHTLSVIDLPAIKQLRVTYRYPAWTGMKEFVEDPGGDLRAVEGTEAEISLQTDRPMPNGLLVLDDKTEVKLEQRSDGWMVGRVPIKKDGMYHVASAEPSERVRISEDFFIEAQKESEPNVRIITPMRDAR
ncbi:MAG: hypothetical protein AB7O65_10320, partial [Candidatus Korobacteraceae bacterium]